MGKNNSIISNGVHNVVAAGTKITGKIESVENFRIEGEIEGDIECQGKIIISETSVVKGNIYCNNLELCGFVKGNISCQDTTVLRKNSQLLGDIVTKLVEIELDAQIIGSIKTQYSNDKA